jgi:hypothetical protein
VSGRVIVTTTQPASRQQPQQSGQSRQAAEAALIAAIIAAFLAFHTAKSLLARLRAPFRRIGVSGKAAQAAIAVVLSMPQVPMEGTGPASRWAVRTNELRRAQFTVAASRRIQQAIDQARAQGEPLGPAIGDAARAEQRYFAQHVQADAGRIRATSAVDGAADAYGDEPTQQRARAGLKNPPPDGVVLLGWHAVKDRNVTPGCLRADGCNFRADKPPVIEGHPSFPGTVHARCRCFPVRPFPGAPVLP